VYALSGDFTSAENTIQLFALSFVGVLVYYTGSRFASDL
jgi:hypothetical protein